MFKTLLVAALPALTLAAPKVETLGQLPPPAFFENIAIRPSGAILATLVAGGPDVYTVTSPSSPNRSFDLLTSIPAVDALTGITEVLDENGKGLDKYIVTGGNSTSEPPNDIVTGSWSAWLISFDGDDVVTEQISELSSETALSNGMVSVPNAVLLADSGRGSVSRLDLSTLTYEDSILALPEMLTTPDFELGIGINGIRIFDSHLYFSNSATASIFRFPITEAGYPKGSCSGPELVANVTSVAPGIDDFEIDEEGNIYATTNYGHVLVYVDGKTGELEIIAGSEDEFTVAGCSAAAFGRTKKDRSTLYVTTAQATIGNVTEGGRILAVEL